MKEVVMTQEERRGATDTSVSLEGKTIFLSGGSRGIVTAAVMNLLGGEEAIARSRTPRDRRRRRPRHTRPSQPRMHRQPLRRRRRTRRRGPHRPRQIPRGARGRRADYGPVVD